MHKQEAFSGFVYEDGEYSVTNDLCNKVLSLPFHPYMEITEAETIVERIKDFKKSYE